MVDLWRWSVREVFMCIYYIYVYRLWDAHFSLFREFPRYIIFTDLTLRKLPRIKDVVLATGFELTTVWEVVSSNPVLI